MIKGETFPFRNTPADMESGVNPETGEYETREIPAVRDFDTIYEQAKSMKADEYAGDLISDYAVYPWLIAYEINGTRPYAGTIT